MEALGITEAQKQLSHWVRAAEMREQAFALQRHGRSVAALVPFTEATIREESAALWTLSAELDAKKITVATFRERYRAIKARADGKRAAVKTWEPPK